MARALKRVCPECNTKAIIKKTVKIHKGLDNLYIYCTNRCCNYVWVENVEFSHTVKKSYFKIEKQWQTFVNSLQPEQKAQLKLALSD